MADHTTRSKSWRIIPILLILMGIVITGSVALAGAPTSLPSGSVAAPASQGKGNAQTQGKPTTSSQTGNKPVTLPPARPNVVLYDQINNPAPAGGVTSQDFEAANDPFDSFAADDFVVPTGQTWTVNGVDVVGEYSNGTGPAASFNVYFYNDAATLPGALVASRPTQSYTGGASAVITISPVVVLPPGTYWVSVQARQDFSPAGQWFWDNRTVISNSGAAWQNPGGGFGTGCPTWGRKTTCLTGQNGPDQLFRINGALQGTPTPTTTGTPPTSTTVPTATATACVVNYTITNSSGVIVPGTTDTGNHCDDCNTAIALPFPISLYGTVYNTAQVGSNGFLSFATFSNFFYSGCLPNTNFTYTIFPFETDQDTTPAGKGIFTLTTGTAPNRTLYVEWRNCRYNGGTCLPNSDNNYEIVFQEGQTSFTIVYGTFGTANATVGAIGVQGATGQFTQSQCNAGAPATTAQVYTLGACGTATGTVVASTATTTRTNTAVATSTATATRTSTATVVVGTATATACVANYTTTTSTGAAIIPGTTLLPGSQGDDQTAPVAFPFPVLFYGVTYNNGLVSTNGNLQFTGNTAYLGTSCPLPDPNLGASIMAYQDDLHTGNAGEGIFTALNGTAPNRTFVIEWRAHYFARTGTNNEEIVFYENQSFFDIVYGVNVDNGTFEESGVQASASGPATQFSCLTATLTAGLRVRYTPGVCGTATSTATAVAATATSTATAVANTATTTRTSTAVVATATCSPSGGTLGPWGPVATYTAPVEAPALGSDGTYAYTAGGFIGGAASNVAQRYDPGANTWISRANLPVALYATRGIYAANSGKFYVFGGYNGAVVNTTYIYDPVANSWTTGAVMPAGRSFPNIAYNSANGKIYVIGGFDPAETEANQTWQYDPIANTWDTTRANIPVAMAGSGTSIVGQFIYIAGTWNAGAGSTLHYRYDIVGNTWATRAAIPANTYAPGSGAVGTNAYIFGGGNPSFGPAEHPGLGGFAGKGKNQPNTSYNTTRVYDTVADSWTVGPNLTTAHSFTAGTTIGNRLLVVGGFDGTADTNVVESAVVTTVPCTTTTATSTNTATVGTTTATATVCVPSAGGWTAGPAVPLVGLVRGVGVYFPANGKFYSMGGRTADTAGSDLTVPYEYTPGSPGTWAAKTALLPDNQVNNMACGVLTLSGTPYIYCVGGSAAGATTAIARVFYYNPVTDAAMTTLPAADNWPGDAGGATLPGGFAVVSNKLYTVGGFNISVAMINQTWEFDPSAAPGSKWTAKMNYPVARGYVPTAAIGGLIYTAGGSDFISAQPVDTTDSYVYNVGANTWTAIPNIPRATGETRAVAFNGQIWVLGGGRTAPNPSNLVDVFTPGAPGTWSAGPAFVTARRNFPADTNGTVIWIAGGYAPTAPTNTMEIYRPGVVCGTNTPTVVANTPTRTNTVVVPPTSTRTNTAGVASPTPCAGGGPIIVNGAITTSDPTQTGRLFRGGVASACGAPNPCSTIGGTYHYDLLGPYVNTSGSTVCITVQLDTACTGTNFIFSGGYVGPFNPALICTNNVGDAGLSPNGAPVTYGFNVPAGGTFYVNVAEVTANAGCAAYMVTITGLPGGACTTPTNTVVAATATATRTNTVVVPPTVTRTNTPPVGGTSTPTVCVPGPQMFTGSIVAGDASHANYVDADTIASSCAAPETCPGVFTATGPWHYDTYTIANTTGASQCVTINIAATCGGGVAGLYSAAYLGSFDPNNLCTNFRGDSVGLIADGTTESYSVTIPAGGTLVIDVEEYTNNQGCGSYTVTVSGLGACGTSTPTATPVVGTPTNTSIVPPATSTRTNTVVVPPATSTRTNTVVVPPSTSTRTATAGVPTASPTICIMKFEDVHPEDWFYGYVEYLYCHGVISGYNTIPPCVNVGRICFKPGNNTTRGQMAKIVVRAFNFPINTTGGPHFIDVAPGSTFYTYIETGKNMGLFSGYADGTYRPNNDVTRGQIAKIIVNAAIIADPGNWTLLNPANNTFQDVPVGSTFYRHIETAAAHNILAGYPCGLPPAGPCQPGNRPYYLPGVNATRAQISKITYLAITFPPSRVK